MTVTLDATPLRVATGGIRRYVEELTSALRAEYPEHNFLHADSARPWFWSWRAGRAARSSDVFHGTDFTVPYLPWGPAVMTVHDLSPWLDDAASERVRRRTPVLLGLGLATMIITPSETIRRSVIDHFRLPPSRVAATPLAAAACFSPRAAADAGRYFLLHGTLEPRKNVATAIAAYRALERTDVELRLTGAARAHYAIPQAPGVKFLGPVEDDVLAELYSNAVAVLYPSEYEGFGLPVIEAMACGAPVIASRDPAVRETAGDAALHADARDVRGWGAAMRALLDSPEQRIALRERSLARAAEFSWTRTAKLTFAVYEEARRRA